MRYRALGQILLSFLLFSAAPLSAQGEAIQTRPAVLRLNLKQAVDLALGPEGSARIRLAEELIRQAEARSAQSRAALLPNLDATVSQQSVTRNLAAFGIRVQLPIPGFSFPVFVGPFNVFDARATASQTVFDLSSFRRYQAAKAGISHAEAEREGAQDEVREQVARAYLAVLRAEAAVEAAQANTTLAQSLLELASDQKAAGTGTGIEITRANVQLANEKQRLLSAETERTRAQLQLLRTIGLDLDATLQLDERLAYVPVPPIPPQQAVRIALDARADWKAQQKRETTARLSLSATRLERIPSVNLFADYGSIGTGIDNALPTRTYGFTVRVPVFDGGRRDARRGESSSVLRQEQIRTRDLRAQIEMEIRIALASLQSASEQVKTSEEGFALAQDELARAERRYKSGFGSSIEVTDAQTRVERARENRIAALFNHNLARIDLSSALGTLEDFIR
jgi:outer membrane protein TolC